MALLDFVPSAQKRSLEVTFASLASGVMQSIQRTIGPACRVTAISVSESSSVGLTIDVKNGANSMIVGAPWTGIGEHYSQFATLDENSGYVEVAAGADVTVEATASGTGQNVVVVIQYVIAP